VRARFWRATACPARRRCRYAGRSDKRRHYRIPDTSTIVLSVLGQIQADQEVDHASTKSVEVPLAAKAEQKDMRFGGDIRIFATVGV
jgi:hypothetical protein